MPTRSELASQLLGLAEVADLLDTSRAQALRWTKRDDFPEPVAKLAATPVWLWPEVLRWAERNDRPITISTEDRKR